MNRMLICTGVLPLILASAIPAFSQIRPNAVTDTLLSGFPRQAFSSDFSSKQKSSLKSLAAPDAALLPRDKSLTVFGRDLFRQRQDAYVSPDAGALTLPPHYQLGPGDRLGLYLLGKVQENIDVTVNVEGKIFVPPIGVIDVWGLNLADFNKVLSRKLGQFYDNFSLDVMLLQPKQVIVAVVGDVVHPGKYVLSALHTVLDAVILAGGPTEKGSIRGIQLIRNDTLATTVDLYRFLMTGGNSEDTFLQAGDRIYVPLARNWVTVSGEVGRPAIFELTPELDERLTDLLELAGGLTELAYPNKVELSRLEEDGHRTLRYIDLSKISAGDSADNAVLRNMDKVRVYSKMEQIHERQVSIFGEIRKPGQYALENNMHVSDLILKAGNLTRRAYTLQAEVAKIDPGQPTKFLEINLNELTDGADGQSDILLEEDDQVFIRRIPEWEVGLTVQVRGEVRFPGAYPIVKDSTHLSEILRKAGGFTPEAFLQEAYVIRPDKHQKVDKEFERLLQMRREEMTDLEYQYLVMRQNSSNVDRIVVDFDKLMNKHVESEDIILENGDLIVAPKAPRVVTVTGSVAKPGGVTYAANAGIDYYIARAGGPSWDAKLRKTKVVKVTGEVLDDEDVESFEPGDIIWVPRKSGLKFWPVFLQTMSVLTQMATIYLVVDRARN